MPSDGAIGWQNEGVKLLFGIGALLLLAVALTLGSLYLRHHSSEFMVRENAVWAAYQLDRETAKLEAEATNLLAGQPNASLAKLIERFDILYSRTDLIKSGSFHEKFRADANIFALGTAAVKAITDLTPDFDRMQADMTVTPDDLKRLLSVIADMRPTTEALLLAVNQEQGLLSVERRDEIANTYAMLAVALAAFTVTMLAAIALLARQMRQIDLARARSEALGRDLEAAAAAAEAGNRAKSAFLATMSHEIRTPLNGIIGMVELLEETALTENQSEKVDSIRDCGLALVELINDILDFSKLESGYIDLETLEFSLGDVVDSVTDVVATRARERDLTVLGTYPETIIQTDPTRLRQILLNLMGNAVKFTARGSVVFRAIEQTPREGVRWFRFEIEDTGIGIAADKLGRLFNEFTQVEASITRRFGGTGLGLAICRKLVTALGGTIGVDSTEGIGSCFWFNLPVGPAMARAAEPQPTPTVSVVQFAAKDRLVAEAVWFDLEERGIIVEPYQLGSRPMDGVPVLIEAGLLRQPGSLEPQMVPPEAIIFGFGASAFADGDRVVFDGAVSSRRMLKLLADHSRQVKLARLGTGRDDIGAAVPDEQPPVRNQRILLVEDNLVNQRVARELLERIGHTVDIAENGAIALEKVKTGGYDLILMDMQMPVMDGLEATRKIRALAGNVTQVPIIGLTANAFASDRTACLDAGMNDFLAKPVTRKKLEAALIQWLPTARRPDGVARQQPAATAHEAPVAAGPRVFDDRQRSELATELGWDIVADLTDAFWNDAGQLIEEAAAAAHAGDRDALDRVLHTIKGASANLGLAAITDAASALKDDLRNQVIPDLGQLQAAVLLTRIATDAASQPARVSLSA